MCGCRRPPKISKSSLLAERMNGSSVVFSSKPRQELTSNEHVATVRSEGSDADAQLSSPPKTSVASVTGSDDAQATSRSVVSACSIESAIDSVISQARAEVATVPVLPATLPPDLVECVNTIKDVVCYHLTCATSLKRLCSVCLDYV